LDSSSANVETWNSSSANVKTFSSSSANVKTLDSSSANVKTLDSSSATFALGEGKLNSIKDITNGKLYIKKDAFTIEYVD
jgi:hypothetical protein